VARSAGTRKKAFWLVAPMVGALLLLGAAQRAYLPADSALARAAGRLTCPFRAATGHPCPFCGLTTSMALTLRGEPGAALAAHPLGPAVVVLAVGLLVAVVWRRAGKNKIHEE
jgi:hypothetical protein